MVSPATSKRQDNEGEVVVAVGRFGRGGWVGTLCML